MYYATAPATAPALSGVQGHILGSMGASGAALAATVLLIVGARGKKKIKFSKTTCAVVGFIAGTLYIAAAQIWSTPASITQSLQQSVQTSIGGVVGGGSIALVMVLLIWGADLKNRTSSVLGIALPSICLTAGGVWTIVSTTVAAALNQWLIG